MSRTTIILTFCDNHADTTAYAERDTRKMATIPLYLLTGLQLYNIHCDWSHFLLCRLNFSKEPIMSSLIKHSAPFA